MNVHLRIVALLLLLTPTACPKQPTEPPEIPNPASKNCIDKGGTLEIVDTPEGQQGICTLKDLSLIHI